MHALHLDFLHPTAAAPRLGLALLLVGLVVNWLFDPARARLATEDGPLVKSAR